MTTETTNKGLTLGGLIARIFAIWLTVWLVCTFVLTFAVGATFNYYKVDVFWMLYCPMYMVIAILWTGIQAAVTQVLFMMGVIKVVTSNTNDPS